MKSTKEKLQEELTTLQQCAVGADKHLYEAKQNLETWEKLKFSVGLTYESHAVKVVNNAFKRQVQRAEYWVDRWKKDTVKIETKIAANKGK